KGGSCIENERRALLDIRSDMYDSGEIFSTWIGEDCCRWRGVACDNTTSHVIKLDLHYPYTRHSYTDYWDDDDDIYFMLKEMGASKVNPALRDLKHLKYLDLSMNNFFGSHIPDMIASLVHLEYLNLSNAMFDGLIPPQLGNLSNLHYLDLGGCGVNDLRADDLDWLSRISSLKYVDMSSVNLSKATNWLHQVNSIPSLEVLDLSCWVSLPYIPAPPPPFNLTSIVKLVLSGYSNLNTTILRWLSHASSLAYLDLSSCSGIDIESLQVTLGALSNLKELYLQYNGIKGEIFGLIMNASRSLKYLDLSWNSLIGDMGQILRSLGPFGMIMNVSSRLKHLDLSWNSLSGDIGQILRSLGSLEYLALDYNKFNGDILEMVKNAPSNLQYLSLRFNHITGEISQTVKNLTNLEYLDLSYTNVPGGILMAFCDLINLKSLILQGNNISRQIPKTIGNLSSLEYLDLSCNNITGGIPTTFADLINLKRLILRENKISGQISEAIGNLRNIRWLDVSYNHLTKLVFGTLNKLCNLSFIDLSFNQIGGELTDLIDALPDCNQRASLDIYIRANNLSGIVPSMHMANLTSLQVLDLSSNNLSGSIPSSLGNCSAMVEIQHDTTSLLHLDGVSYYDESIVITAKGSDIQYTTILSLVTSIDLSNNNLSGEIPRELTNLHGLLFLNLSKNHLRGTIPEKIGSMEQLESLDLSMNNLTGDIPSSLSSLTFLSHLNLSHNNLSGRIPTAGGQMSTFNASIYDGNEYLCGTPLPECPGDAAHQSPAHEHEQKNGDRLETVWEITSIVMGFVVGFWSFVGTMIMKQSIRMAFFRVFDKAYDWCYVHLAV
ncbi:unnamed protein product, partial [Musa banksii]